MIRIMAFGDVVGKPGRMLLAETLPLLRKKFDVDFVMVNGENAAGGFGLTTETLNALLNAGADVVTSGNHIWKHREIYSRIQKEPRLLRPANYPDGAPGRGLGLYTTASGHEIAVLNLMGVSFMEPLPCPFTTARSLLAQIPEHVTIRLVDFHAEASSEKRALAFFLDGKVSALLGSHTHVQTADAMILPKGSAYLTDMGMCGVEYQSIIGMSPETIVARVLTRMPQAFKPAKGTPSLNGVLLEIDPETGHAQKIQLLRKRLNGHSGTDQVLVNGVSVI